LSESFPKPLRLHRSTGGCKKLIAWERPLRKADYAALIADDPGVYFTTPHFDGYPAVLVRLDEIRAPELAQAPKTLARQFLETR